MAIWWFLGIDEEGERHQTEPNVVAIDAGTRADLLEIIDDRSAQRATIITYQLPIAHWHAWLGDPTVADAILDRLMQHCRRFSLDGESRRTGRAGGVESKLKKTTGEAKS